MKTETSETQETELIPVPSFEGYKCLGYTNPKKGQYYLRNCGDLGLVTSDMDCKWVAYEKIVPKRYIFEETGEFRRVSPGEYCIKDGNVTHLWTSQFISNDRYKILRKVEE